MVAGDAELSRFLTLEDSCADFALGSPAVTGSIWAVSECSVCVGAGGLVRAPAPSRGAEREVTESCGEEVETKEGELVEIFTASAEENALAMLAICVEKTLVSEVCSGMPISLLICPPTVVAALELMDVCSTGKLLASASAELDENSDLETASELCSAESGRAVVDDLTGVGDGDKVVVSILDCIDCSSAVML